MIFTETYLLGAFVITFEPIKDERGFFARSFCKKEFRDHGLQDDFVQCNISNNIKKGTLRGLHYQAAPYEEVKIVSCICGSIYDVIVDIRPSSPTFGRWFAIELTAQNYQALYIPKGFAHGFQTLCDKAEVFYHMSNYYYSTAARGIRWNDVNLAIPWPDRNIIISEQDKNLPELSL